MNTKLNGNDLINWISCPYPGELLPLERFLLHHYIFLSCPSVVLEVGCGEGASTYYIAEALRKNGRGQLYTCDPIRQPTEQFLWLYSDNVNYFSSDSEFLIDRLISKNTIPSFVFFDGPEDPIVALDDFKRLDPYLQTGTIFSMHDWHTGPNPRIYDNNISTKADLIKPYINSLENWKLIQELSGTEMNEEIDVGDITLPGDSVGLAFYRKV